jgi:hypothetical protein
MEDPDQMDWSGPEFVPMTATQVARRSLILSAVVCRGSIEYGGRDADAQSLHERTQNWLTHLDLWNDVEPSEAVILRTPLGLLDAADTIQATWYAEGLAVLAWALKHVEFPQLTEQVDSYEVTDELWFLDASAGDVVINAELRTPTELEAVG